MGTFSIRYAASVVLSMTYGKVGPTSYNDPEVVQINKSLDILGRNILPYSWRVDTYPILRYLPGYLAPLRRWHVEELGLFRSMMDIAKKNIVSMALHSLTNFVCRFSSSGYWKGAWFFCKASVWTPGGAQPLLRRNGLSRRVNVWCRRRYGQPGCSSWR